jgi:hypothetical protein
MLERIDNPMHTAREHEPAPECDGQPFCDETGTETCGQARDVFQRAFFLPAWRFLTIESRCSYGQAEGIENRGGFLAHGT